MIKQMAAKIKEYEPERDFIRVRDFLKKNYFAFDKPLNWGLERWNWGRYHPSMFVETDPKETKRRILKFEKSIRLWVDDMGVIVAMVHRESSLKEGEFFFQQSPGSYVLFDEMFDFACKNLFHPIEKSISMMIFDYDDKLKKKATELGFIKKVDGQDYTSDFMIDKKPAKNIKEDFYLQSMADEGDLAKRCRLNGLGFNHSDPKDWTTPAEYKEVQKAPDYRRDLDLFIVSPRGEYVSGCIVWYDDFNKVGYYEPVCTIPEFRRLGMGREVMMEGIRRLADLGATKAFVGSSQKFYKSLGFELNYPVCEWVKQS